MEFDYSKFIAQQRNGSFSSALSSPSFDSVCSVTQRSITHVHTLMRSQSILIINLNFNVFNLFAAIWQTFITLSARHNCVTSFGLCRIVPVDFSFSYEWWECVRFNNGFIWIMYTSGIYTEPACHKTYNFRLRLLCIHTHTAILSQQQQMDDHYHDVCVVDGVIARKNYIYIIYS